MSWKRKVAEAHSASSQTSMIDLNGFQLLIIFAKSSDLKDVRLGSEHASE